MSCDLFSCIKSAPGIRNSSLALPPKFHYALLSLWGLLSRFRSSPKGGAHPAHFSTDPSRRMCITSISSPYFERTLERATIRPRCAVRHSPLVWNSGLLPRLRPDHSRSFPVHFLSFRLHCIPFDRTFLRVISPEYIHGSMKFTRSWDIALQVHPSSFLGGFIFLSPSICPFSCLLCIIIT